MNYKVNFSMFLAAGLGSS